MANVKCPTGWLVVPSESGESYVPFFVHVREEDIHWKKDKYLKELVDSMTDVPTDSVESIRPGHNYRILRNGWSVELQCDGLVTATKQLTVDDSFSIGNEENTIIEGIVDLPLFIKNDEFFNVQTTLLAEDEFLRYGITSVNKITDSVTINGVDVSGYNNFKVNIYSPAQSFNSRTFIADCNNSRIFVTVRGYLPLVEYKG